MNVITHYTARQYTASLSGNLLSLSTYDKRDERDYDKRDERDTNTPNTQKKRQIITKFTESSRRRLVKYCREIPKNRFKNLITLTYPTAPNPILSKQHLDRMIELLRRNAADTLSPRPNAHALENTGTSKTPACLNGGAVLQCAAASAAANIAGEKSGEKEKAQKAKRTRLRATAFSALWIMEYQKRGVVHYHIWSTHWFPKAELMRLWNQIIDAPPNTPSTRVDSWKAYTKSGLASYVSKYARKEAQKELPPELLETGAGRWWGKSGDTSTPLAIKKRINEQDFDCLINLAKEKAKENVWREITFDYANLYVVCESDRIALFQLIEQMGSHEDKT